MSDISANLKSLRIRRGFSQAELAAEVGVTRQTINSIEAGRYVPGTEIALRIADALLCRVEDIFRLENQSRSVAVSGDVRSGERVVLGRVGDRNVVHALRGSRVSAEGFVPADAHVTRRGEAQLLQREDQLSNTALLAGCDPSLSVLAAFVSRKVPDARISWLHSSSEDALQQVSDGNVHIAGTHLPDPQSDDCNVSQARQALSRRGGVVIRYAAWEQGLIVAAGNPLGIRSVADLAQRDVRFVNRERGSGSRRLLDDALDSSNVPSAAITGYEIEVPSHMAVARMIAAGAVDAGIALRAVANAFGLGFVPLVELRFDLVIPSEHLTHPSVVAMLDVMQSRWFRAELAALPGYDTRQTGSQLMLLAAA